MRQLHRERKVARIAGLDDGVQRYGVVQEIHLAAEFHDAGVEGGGAARDHGACRQSAVVHGKPRKDVADVGRLRRRVIACRHEIRVGERRQAVCQVDLDPVRRNRQPGDEARLYDDAVSPGVGNLVPEVRIPAGLDRCVGEVLRRVLERCKVAILRVRRPFRLAVGQSNRRVWPAVDAVCVAGIDAGLGKRAVARRKELSQRRRAEVAAARRAEHEVVDDLPAAAGAPHAFRAGDRVVDISEGSAQLQFLEEGDGSVAAEDRDQNLCGNLVGVVAARRRDLHGAVSGQAQLVRVERRELRLFVAMFVCEDEIDAAGRQGEQGRADGGQEIDLLVDEVFARAHGDIIARGLARIVVAERIERGAGRIVVERIGVGVDGADRPAHAVRDGADRVVETGVVRSPALVLAFDAREASGNGPVEIAPARIEVAFKRGENTRGVGFEIRRVVRIEIGVEFLRQPHRSAGAEARVDCGEGINRGLSQERIEPVEEYRPGGRVGLIEDGAREALRHILVFRPCEQDFR